ncbi:MAG: oligosaccharide flippase family protein [Bacteroidetes bacterium]|nr:oligosaccharide flippase family protein [Bacteroidota bacterium]
MAISSQNLRNSGWSIINILLYPIAFMALTPVFINRMGELQFGIWMLVNSYVFIAVNIISFGFSNSITAHVAEALGKNDRVKLFAYVNSSTRILATFALATVSLAMLAFLVLVALPATGLFKVGDIFSYPGLDMVLVVATLLISVKFHELLYQSVFKGFERFDLSGKYNILNKFLVLGLQLVLVLKGQGLLVIFLGSLGINSAIVAIQGFVMHRILPGYRFRLHKNPAESKDLFIFGFWTWIQTIISVAAYQVDRFIVAIALGPIVAGYYILASTIANHMHMAFGAMASWLFPKVARQKENSPGTLIYFHTLRGFTVGVSLLAILVVSLVYKPFFTLWLGADKFAKIGPFFALFLMYETMLILSIVPQFYLNGIKMLRFITFLELMYKAGILAGMFIAFSLVPTGESLLLGQIIALVILMPVEYFLVNDKILHDHPFGETVITMVPSLCVVCSIYFHLVPLTAGLTIIALVTFVQYYLAPARFNLKLLVS